MTKSHLPHMMSISKIRDQCIQVKMCFNLAQSQSEQCRNGIKRERNLHSSQNEYFSRDNSSNAFDSG